MIKDFNFFRNNENVQFEEDWEEVNPDVNSCVKCGHNTNLLIDHEPLSLYGDGDIRIDDEIYGTLRCGNCGYEENIKGDITWKRR